MILHPSIIEELLLEPNSNLIGRLSAVHRCLHIGIHDDNSVLSVLSGMPHVVMKLFQMVDDFSATLRNITFIVEYIKTHTISQLQQEYINALDYHTLDHPIKKALLQWKSFTQLSSHFIKTHPEWAVNMALNQCSSSFVYQDTKTSSFCTHDSRHRDEWNNAMVATYPLYWTNQPSNEEEHLMLMEYCTGQCWKVSATNIGRSMVAVVREWKYKNDDVFLYDLNTGELLHQLGLKVGITVLTFVNNSNNDINATSMWLGCEDGYLRVYDTANGTFVWTRDLGEKIVSIQSLNEDMVLCATRQGNMHFFSQVTGLVMTMWSTGKDIHLAVYHHSKHCIITAHGMCLSCFTMEGVLMHTVDLDACVYGVAVHPVRVDIIVFSSGGRHGKRVQQMNIESGEVINTIHKGDDHMDSRVSAISPCFKVSYAREGDRVVCVSQCGTYVLVYNTDGSLLNRLHGKRRSPAHLIAPINDICVLPSVARVVTVGQFGCTLFNIPNTPEEHAAEKRSEILGCCLLPGGDEFITLSEEGELSKWSTKTYRKLCAHYFIVSVDSYRYLPLKLHPNGSLVVFTKQHDCLLFVDTFTLQTVADVIIDGEDGEGGYTKHIHDIVISREGDTCIVERESAISSNTPICFTTIVYDIKDLKNIKNIGQAPPRWVNLNYRTSKVDVHHNGKLLVTACDDGISLWSLDSQKKERLRRGTATYVRFAYQPERIMWVQHREGEGTYSPGVFIMDFQGVVLCSSPGVLHHEHSVLLINNDTQLITGNRDNSLQIHDAHTGEILYTFFHFSSEGFGCLDFDAEKGILIVANRNDKIFILKTETIKCLS